MKLAIPVKPWLCLFIAAEATFTTGVDHIQSGGAELAYGRKTRKGAAGGHGWSTA